MIEPGTVIDGKYEIGRVIGSGGMGAVYEAVQLELNRKVAIKLLHTRYAKSPKIIDRFHQEAKLAGSIDHDNICRVTDHGTDKNGAPYLVMPLLVGKSLAELLAEKKPISQLRVIDIACQTLSALEAAHNEKIVHRDLKPDNIFVTRMGDREDFVKLLDFGISKVLEKESATALTSTGMVLGTAYYLAPEQARGSRNIDRRVDIFAMGVILYEALTGSRPFEGETYNEVVFKIAGEPVKMPRLLNPSISKAVEHVILKAMSVDPNCRYASAMEMCAVLEQAVVNGENPYIDGVADTLADTLADTKIDHAAGRSAASIALRRKRLLLGAILGVLSAAFAGVVYMISGSSSPADTVPSSDDAELAAPAANTLPLEPTNEETVSAVVEPPSGAVIPQEIASDKADTDTKPSDTDQAVLIEKQRGGEPLRVGSKSPRGKAPEKTAEKNVIKGNFNTTFVFENE